MKKWRQIAFEQFSENIAGLDGYSICPEANPPRLLSNKEILAAVYHEIHLENDCASTSRLQWLVVALEQINRFGDIKLFASYVSEELHHIPATFAGVLEYLQTYESGNEDLHLHEFLHTDNEMCELASELVALIPLKRPEALSLEDTKENLKSLEGHKEKP